MKKAYLIFIFNLVFTTLLLGQPIEKMPEFNGGYNALTSHVVHAIKYPPLARDSCILGMVIVGFIVDTTGNVDSLEIIHSVHFLLDNEAMRVIKTTSGYWTPGSLDGKFVRVKFKMPINFSLANAGCKDSDYYYDLGVKYYEKGDFASALRSYKQAIKINPHDIDALFNCAVLNIKLGDFDSGCIYLNKIKEMSKNDADELIAKYCKN